MTQEIELNLSPRQAYNDESVRAEAAKAALIPVSNVSHCKVLRRSVDARKRDIRVLLRVRISDDSQYQAPAITFGYRDVSQSRPVIIVGAGPAGMFAATRLIQQGIKPIVLERGKDVSARKRDIAQLYRTQIVDPESNFCFGEGGAGTFSDGKLYTRSKKRGDIQRVLEEFVHHGAKDEILIDVHPHIGSNLLPTIMANMRKCIIEHGGEVHFNTKVTDIHTQFDQFTGVSTQTGETFSAKAMILATGHSARDIYELLHRKGITIEAKAFAMGVRIEHPQFIIDRIQYHNSPDIEFLPPASYSVVEQVRDRGVYSFCMCPGGIIVPAASAGNESVVNGMSNATRNSPFANSGIAVEIRVEDMQAYAEHGPLAGMEMQRQLEQMARVNGGRGLTAPAQRLNDFVRGRISQDLPAYSYLPGAECSPLHFWLPEHIGTRLQEGFSAFGHKMRGYFTNEAVLLGVESRTSSPVRIPRDKDTFQHIQIQGLFPCGEGAGYAGGIVSSAMDGQQCADMAAQQA